MTLVKYGGGTYVVVDYVTGPDPWTTSVRTTTLAIIADETGYMQVVPLYVLRVDTESLGSQPGKRVTAQRGPIARSPSARGTA